MKSYTAITIGPIKQTLQSARSTKAFWAASYSFSFIAKELIRSIIDQKIAAKADFILPYFDSNEMNSYPEMGLFPDRILIQKSIDNGPQIINDVLEKLADIIAKDLSENTPDVLAFCKAYFRIRILSPINLDDFEQDGKTPTNVMHNTFQLLDAAELQTGTNPFVEKDYLVRFFEKVPGFNNSNTYNFFHRKAFPNIRKFPSTAEIATAEFEGQLFYEQLRSDLNDQTKQVEEERQQEIFYKKIRTHQKDKFRNYMKYMAVVQGDGDNFGELIRSIYKHNPNLTNDFSKTIFDFTQNAATKVSEILHGYPVYAGGDDILFFAPLAHTFFENDQVICIKTIFDVIDEIDKIFNKTIKEGILSTVISKSVNPVSMSYGVAVAYYKFPLGEIQEYAANQLFGCAKKAKNKNAISIKVIKHSGNGFETTFLKPQDSGTKNAYTQFKDLLKCSDESPNFLRGIVHKLLLQEHVFSAIGSNKNLSERNAQFEQFFIQNFNEGVHTKKNKEGQKILIEFLQQLLVFCQIIYSENEVLTADNQKENMDYLRAALQFISFIHNKEESI